MTHNLNGAQVADHIISLLRDREGGSFFLDIEHNGGFFDVVGFKKELQSENEICTTTGRTIESFTQSGYEIDIVYWPDGDTEIKAKWLAEEVRRGL